MYETYGYPALEEEIKMFIEYFDLNHDGKVTLDEFKTALKNMREQLHEKMEWQKNIKATTSLLEIGSSM